MKSIFDGWTKKIEHKLRDGDGGFCAVGYAWSQSGGGHTLVIIGKWIIANMEPPEKWMHKEGVLHFPRLAPLSAVVWANNEKKLDIEGFKMVDLLTQGYVPDEAPTEQPVGEVAK